MAHGGRFFCSVVKWAGIEGSTIKRLYNGNILNTVIALPSVEEQERIGAYFQTLDHLITLQQRKLIKLQTIKKAMLEKMFPLDARRDGMDRIELGTQSVKENGA